MHPSQSPWAIPARPSPAASLRPRPRASSRPGDGFGPPGRAFPWLVGLAAWCPPYRLGRRWQAELLVVADPLPPSRRRRRLVPTLRGVDLRVTWRSVEGLAYSSPRHREILRWGRILYDPAGLLTSWMAALAGSGAGFQALRVEAAPAGHSQKRRGAEPMAQADVPQMLELLRGRGVDPEDLVRLVLKLQRPYVPDLTADAARAHLHAVLAKREVEYAIITGVILDRMAEEGRLDEPLGSIVREDPSLYGVDKGLALSIVNAYGSIGMSNFGYLVHERPDVLEAFRTRPGRVCTFLDDLIAGLVAATCARIAHRAGDAAEGRST